MRGVIKEGLIVLHPVRWKIIQALKERTPMYIDEIAEAIKEDRRLVSFHLSTLERNSYVESDFKIIERPKSKGKAGRFYKLTPKIDEVLSELVKIIEKGC